MNLSHYSNSQTDQINEWLKETDFRNHSNEIIGKCFIVRRPSEEVYLDDVMKTFVWCSKHTTAPWTKVLTGAYIFVSEKDAEFFKLVWG